jgi:general secretion pathway protein J
MNALPSRHEPRFLAAQVGFTLVELLVGVVILSMIMAGLLAALRSYAVTGERLDQRLRQEDENRLVLGFLRQVIGSAQPISEGKTDSRRQVWFFGGERDLQWVGVMPARHGVGGLYRMRLSLASGGSEESLQLVLDYAPMDKPNNDAGWLTHASRAVLFPAVRGMAITYEDPKAQPPERWLRHWPHPDRLPLRVRIDIERNGLPLPPQFISILGRPDSVTGTGIFVIGGG